MTEKKLGFLQYQRQEVGHRSVEDRIRDFHEIDLPLTPDQMIQQARRCMDCGIPFCHGTGCPLGNRIPEFNEMVYKGQWKAACENLHSTNNFPEITGRVCPAPCETACTLGFNDQPVLIRHIEHQIVERGFAEGWIVPQPPREKSRKRVAVVGSGPAGLAAAQQLMRAGHDTVVFEKDDRVGGLLRFGIPDFKLAKSIIDRRLDQMMAEGVEFQTGVEVGLDVSIRYLNKLFDGLVLTMGAGQPRDLVVPGRGFEGIHFAMEYLAQQNRLNAEIGTGSARPINARDKNVIVIGGGDTGSDCVGTARRQGAKSITQLEILPKPPDARPQDTPWPYWPRTMRTSSSHEEGCDRRWCILTKRFDGAEKTINRIHGCSVEWFQQQGQWKIREVSGSEFSLPADLILLATGFVHVIHDGLIQDLGLQLDERGNVVIRDFQTSIPSVFAAGDTTNGASLVVRAIDSGRQAAAAVDRWLRNTP